jgi:HK97 family phage major capsid protein
MTLAEQLAAMRARRDTALKAMQEIVDGAAAEDRTFTDDESKSFDKHKAETETVNAHIERLETQEKLVAASARPAQSSAAASAASTTGYPSIQLMDRKIKAGTSFARYAMALMASKGNMIQAEQIARNYWRDTTPQLAEMFKAIGQFGSTADFIAHQKAAVAAGSTSNQAWAGVLVYAETMASEFIELLRPATIIGRLPSLRKVPFNIRMARQIGGISTSGWVGQGLSKPVGSLSLDAVVMPWAKVAVIVALTEELARFSDPSAEGVINADMISAISTYLDSQFINPTVAPVTNVSPGSITYGLTPIVSTGSTVAQVTADLATMLSAMASNNIPMTAPAWVMHPRSQIFLSLLRTATDNLAFPSVSANNALLGYPIVTSTSSPLGAGPTFYGQIVLMDQPQVFLADEGGITLDMSREASLQLDSAPSTPPAPLTSLWQQNLIGLKAERFIYWMRRYDPAVQILTDVPY